MRQAILLGIMIIGFSPQMYAQRVKSDIREGNKLFKSEKFEDSELAYRKALDTEVSSIAGNFNLGDALYRQEKFEEAGKQFSSVGETNTSKEVQSQALHNLGNAMLQAGKLDEAIEAYKDALRRNPTDMETKYNLAYALDQKKKQEEQEQNQDQQDKDNKDQEKKDNQDQQDQQDKQNQDQNKDQQDQEKDQQDQQNKDQQDQDKQQQQQPQNKISKSDAERMLAALANDEKKTQEKVKVAKAKAKKVRTLKDW